MVKIQKINREKIYKEIILKNQSLNCFRIMSKKKSHN